MPIDLKHFGDSALGLRVRQVVTKGRSTPAQLLSSVLETVRDVIPALEGEVTYRTEDLCAAQLWESWEVGERRAAGMCLRYLAATGELPLEVASLPGVYPLRFRMKTAG